jgi:hypothetical protein
MTIFSSGSLGGILVTRAPDGRSPAAHRPRPRSWIYRLRGFSQDEPLPRRLPHLAEHVEGHGSARGDLGIIARGSARLPAIVKARAAADNGVSAWYQADRIGPVRGDGDVATHAWAADRHGTRPRLTPPGSRSTHSVQVSPQDTHTGHGRG